jgi:hypothetical protein
MSQAARRRIEKLGAELTRDVRSAAMDGEQLVVVKAPPGSGKTHLLLETVTYCFKRGMRVAVGTQTNAQADDICKRLAEDHPTVKAVRFAANGLRETHLGKTIQWITDKNDLPPKRCIVVGTTAKWGLIKLPREDAFHLMVVDESWQMSWADFMLCSQVSDRFILIGDPGQIPPVVPVDVRRWETSPRAPHQAAPDLIMADTHLAPPERSLPACRRLPADSVDLIRPFYDFDFDSWALPSDRAVMPGKRNGGPAPMDAAVDLLATASMSAISLPTPEFGPPLERDDRVASTAAEVAARLIERNTKVVTDDDGKARALKPSDIGITATHRVMNAAIEASLATGLHGHVRVDTPERWQGLQCAVMIAVHPLSGVLSPSAFDLETGRLCVMASRHRAGLIVVTRDHITQTLETHIPSAEQAVGRPDVTGRGHQQNLAFWAQLEASGCVARVAL